MLPERLRGEELRDYLEALRNSHEYRIHFEVYNADDELVERFGSNDLPILDGQVDVDSKQAVQRQLRATLQLVDGGDTDPTAPGSALAADRQIKVIYEVLVPRTDSASTSSVEVPIFYGPITRVARDPLQVTIEAQSKEVYMLPPNRLVRSVIPDESGGDNERIKSYYMGDLIKRIARRHGETMLRVSRTDRKLPEDAKLLDKASQDTGAWPLLQAIAGSRQLFYDASGHLVLRNRRQTRAAYVFNDGDNGEVLTAPTIDWDLSTFRNTVDLRAFQKKQGNEKENPTLRVSVKLEPSHPMSPRSLARNGVPRELVEVISSEHVYAGEADARRDAYKHLDRLTSGSLSVSFDSLVIPHLEPGDLVAIDLKGRRRKTFSLEQFTIPLTPSPMAVGYNKRVRYGK